MTQLLLWYRHIHDAEHEYINKSNSKNKKVSKEYQTKLFSFSGKNNENVIMQANVNNPKANSNKIFG